MDTFCKRINEIEYGTVSEKYFRFQSAWVSPFLAFAELFSVSKDKSVHIMDVEEGKLVTHIPKAHRWGISNFS